MPAILVTGGVRSGKSRFAEDALKLYDDVVYIATMQVFDSETSERVHAHQKRRPTSWRTVEEICDLSRAVGDEKHYLLDCVGLLVTRRLLEQWNDTDAFVPAGLVDRIAERVSGELIALIDTVRLIGGEIVLVTNEVGLSVVPESPLGRAFRDILGMVNCRLAAVCDRVYLLVCGLEMKIK